MAKTIVTENKTEPIRAVLAGLQTTSDDEGFERALLELARLAEACNVDAVAIVPQRAPHPVHATYLGAGKVDELKATLYAMKATLVVFDQSLTPLQTRNLSRALDAEVIDRTDLILRIFSDRAKTREARLQVEYAQLDYMLPRLVGLRENLSRQGGASGFLSARGAGETQLELDRRRIMNRQAQLRRELKEVERARVTQRQSRNLSKEKRIGLVGYTNAGKSTLMNRLLAMSNAADDDAKRVFEEDMLFATLDTTVRRIAIKGRTPFLLSDTVGFISELPTGLVDAFRSTLAEAAEADMLLEVVDASDPDRDNQSAVTLQTLKEIGAGAIPRIRVMNKTDVAGAHPAGKIVGDTIYISAKNGAGVDALLDMTERALEGALVECQARIPYERGDLVSLLNETATVLSQEYLADGVRILARLTARQRRALESYLEQS